MGQRLFARLSYLPQCEATFLLGGQAFAQVPVLNLGANGCCVRLPALAAPLLEPKARLDRWTLVHPLLPTGPIKANVMWSRLEEEQGGGLRAGVRFQDAPIGYTRRLDEFVTRLAGVEPLSDPLAGDLDGMPA